MKFTNSMPLDLALMVRDEDGVSYLRLTNTACSGQEDSVYWLKRDDASKSFKEASSLQEALGWEKVFQLGLDENASMVH